MKQAVIIGQRGKIGTRVKQTLPDYITLIDEFSWDGSGVDYLFLATDSNKARVALAKLNGSETKIIDYSGMLKDRFLKDDFSVSYGLEKNPKNNLIAMPGCSALGIITALSPLDKLELGSIYADVKFSKSAVRFNSPNYKTESLLLVHPMEHNHQREILKVTGRNVLISPSIVNIPNGLSLNLFFDCPDSIIIEDVLKSDYKSDTNVQVVSTPPKLENVLKTNTVMLFVKQKNGQVLIHVVMDNLSLPYEKFLKP